MNRDCPFKSFLMQRLNYQLPGTRAQNLMSPHPTGTDPTTLKREIPKETEYRNSSVLVPVICNGEDPEIILTLRTQGIKHGGQLSFPGGGREGDESYEETALRECHEEIGLESPAVEITGMLTPLYVNHSKNMVTPVVGFLNERPTFTPNPNEVDEVFTVSFSELLTTENQHLEEWELRNTKYHVPFWDIHHVPLWGATAMMLSELLELYREFRADQYS